MKAWAVPGDSAGADAAGADDLVNVYFTGDHRLRIWLQLAGPHNLDYQSSFQAFEEVPEGGQWLVGNFDGEGGDDLAYVHRGGAGEAVGQTWLSRGAGFEDDQP